MDASFSSNLLSLLDRGFVYAIAHVRGGKEKTWQWYEDGKMMKKINSFNDFIDCAEYLIAQQYTSSDRLFGRGGSAGGLLMGAVYNMRPDLFKGMLAHVPFVDVLTTMSDPSIPLTTGEYTEWGNPDIKEHYDYMKLYSPIDNLNPDKTTNLLVTTGFADSQVQYWEPAKWIAKLRKMRKDKNSVILFYTNLDAGHGGASGRFERLKEIALEYAFMFGLLAENEK
jgi:oligopeptidase B